MSLSEEAPVPKAFRPLCDRLNMGRRRRRGRTRLSREGRGVSGAASGERREQQRGSTRAERGERRAGA